MALRSSRTLLSFCCNSVRIPEASGSSCKTFHSVIHLKSHSQYTYQHKQLEHHLHTSYTYWRRGNHTLAIIFMCHNWTKGLFKVTGGDVRQKSGNHTAIKIASEIRNVGDAAYAMSHAAAEACTQRLAAAHGHGYRLAVPSLQPDRGTGSGPTCWMWMMTRACSAISP